jgi:hypothetical protein
MSKSSMSARSFNEVDNLISEAFDQDLLYATGMEDLRSLFNL